MAEKKSCPKWHKVLKFILPLLVLIAAGLTARYFMLNKPTAERQKPPKIAQLVETEPVSRGPYQLELSVMGTVVPAQSLDLRSQVSGRVKWINPALEPGGLLKEGEELLRLDDTEYLLDVRAAEAALAQAQADLDLELGHQEVARKELELLLPESESVLEDMQLALRRPQLLKAKAQVRQAEAALAQARLDLERTRITSPFDALVVTRSVDLGAELAARETLADLVGTDEYWIEAAVPTHWLEWMQISKGKDHPGSRVRITARPRAGEWSGRVVRLLAGVQEDGRMARVLVSVPGPREAAGTALLLNEFVRLGIFGKKFEDVAILPRKALRQDDMVWIAREGKLDIRRIHPLWRDKDVVLVGSEIMAGELIVVSDLGAPVQGMDVILSQGGRQ